MCKMASLIELFDSILLKIEFEVCVISFILKVLEILKFVIVICQFICYNKNR